MNTVAEVKLWGRRIGAVAMTDDTDAATFQYDPDFRTSGIEIAPLTLPLSQDLFTFPGLPRSTFRGLPGLLADSLPDRFGNALIDAWLASQGRSPASFNAVERLCYTGSRGMGALEFAPVAGPRARVASRIHIDQLVVLASDILTRRQELAGALTSDGGPDALRDILRVGTSAGGARAKAVIAWNPDTDEVRSGQVDTDPGFEHWLLKFDGVGGNRDRELADPQGYGAIEYAYHLMATAAGITMSPCRLFNEGPRRHFMTRRFDRTDTGDKLHMLSLGAIAHFDYNQAGAHSYEQALGVIRQLGLPMSVLEEQVRRMIFNIMARNQDDHVKNIAFLMDKTGAWSLSPAFDMIYSYKPDGQWTARHQMTLNGKRDGFDLEDVKICTRSASMKRGVAEKLVAEVGAAVARWREFADEAGVAADQRDGIQAALRLEGW